MKRLGLVALFLFGFIVGGVIILATFTLSFDGISAQSSGEFLFGVLLFAFALLLVYLWVVGLKNLIVALIKTFSGSAVNA